MNLCDMRSTRLSFQKILWVQEPATALVVPETDTGARSPYRRPAPFAGMSVSVPTVQRILPDWARRFELPQSIHDVDMPEWAHDAVEEIRKPVVSHQTGVQCPRACRVYGFGVCKLVVSHQTRFGCEGI